jgi:hypothetical protein
MNKKIGFILLLVTLVSCERELYYTFKEYQPKLVINALLNNEDRIAVSISNAEPFGSRNEPAILPNATVSLFIDGVRQTDLTYDAFEKKYMYGFNAMPGREYRVVASAPGYPPAEGIARLPGAGTFGKSVFRDSVYTDSFGFPMGEILVRIQDKRDEKNFYRIVLNYFNPTTASFDLMPIESDDPLVNQLASQRDGSVVFSDVTFNGNLRELRFRIPFGFGSGSPKFLVQLENLSEDFYLYSNSLSRYQNTGANIFSEPVLVYSNIKDGLGIFAGSQLVRDTIR